MANNNLSFLLSTGKKVDEAAENRNYLSARMTDEINEIIRVLQLTTYDEDEWDADNLTCMRKAQVGTLEREGSAMRNPWTLCILTFMNLSKS